MFCAISVPKYAIFVGCRLLRVYCEMLSSLVLNNFSLCLYNTVGVGNTVDIVTKDLFTPRLSIQQWVLQYQTKRDVTK